MNWLALLLGWLACIIMFFVGYRLGKAAGHIEGHKCEAGNQIFYDEIRNIVDFDKGNPHDS